VKYRFPLHTLFPTHFTASTAHSFATKLNPPRSAAIRRRFTLASVAADGREEAQGEEMYSEVEPEGGT
jgi:hypothetical protein